MGRTTSTFGTSWRPRPAPAAHTGGRNRRSSRADQLPPQNRRRILSTADHRVLTSPSSAPLGTSCRRRGVRRYDRQTLCSGSERTVLAARRIRGSIVPTLLRRRFSPSPRRDLGRVVAYLDRPDNASARAPYLSLQISP